MCYSALVKRDLDYLSRHYGSVTVREQIDYHLRAVAADPKHFPPLDERIYPGHYAPVIHRRDGQRVTEVMRYSAYPPPSIQDAKKYTTFNARRDNLRSTFWSQAFLVHHGFVVLDAFYEWVAVADLLKAGVVTVGDVKAEFEKQADERKAKVLAAGKKYKPTPTEVKDARFRQIIIEFKPQDAQDLLVPVIYSLKKLEDGHWDAGFAMVTDDPPPEISIAGHDRCPVILHAEGLAQWLQPEGRSAQEMEQILTHQRRVKFTHKLAQLA